MTEHEIEEALRTVAGMAEHGHLQHGNAGFRRLLDGLHDEAPRLAKRIGHDKAAELVTAIRASFGYLYGDVEAMHLMAQEAVCNTCEDALARLQDPLRAPR